MKPCIILVLLLAVVTATMAQEPPLSSDLKQKLDELNRPSPLLLGIQPKVRILSGKDTGKADQFRKLLEAKRLQQGGLITATYSHTTARGKVYTLTPDNMPCLVPDRKAVAPMPTDKSWTPDERMNAWPKQQIIPREEEEGQHGNKKKGN